MSEQAQRDKSIFLTAAEKASATERTAYLDKVCAGDSVLRRRIEALLDAHDHPTDFLDRPPAALASPLHTPTSAGLPGTMIDRYKLLELIGEGGFGEVYLAEQQEPVIRKVALKIIKLGMDTKQVIARFEAERQALALMDHANIAKVLDAGATDTGRPYFVMDLVRGLPITEYCDANNLTTEERLRIFIDVCHAAGHAHQKGIIHRDLKPTNVLVTQDDWKPVPKIIDFGVAKATQQRLTEKTLFTEHRQLVGTPEYMSPEQATFGESDVDIRSDIYSLGVLLYELIVGTTPFDQEELRGRGYDEICRVIREVDPVTPSRKLSALGDAADVVCHHRQCQPATLHKLVCGDLDWIVMKCLEKDRRRRYTSAQDVAEELEKFLAGEPIEARPISSVARVSRWCHRNPLPAGLVATVGGLVLLAAIGGPLMAVKQASLATKEAAARQQAQQLRDASSTLAAELTFDRGLQLCDEGKVGQGMLWLARTLEIAPAAATDLRRVVRLNLGAWRDELYSLELVLPHERDVVAVAFSPDGKSVLTGSRDKSARLWDATSGELLREFAGHAGEINSVAYSPTGETLLTGSQDTTARLWNAATGNLIHKLVGHGEEGVKSVVFSPDGQLVLTGSSDKTARLWNANTGELIRTFVGHEGTIRAVRSVAFSPDGELVLTASMDQTARLWDVATGEVVRVFPHVDEPLASVAFSPDGKMVLTATKEPLGAKLWETATGNPTGTSFRDSAVFHSAVFSQDGSRLLTSGNETTVQLWDATTGQPIGRPFGSEFRVHDVALSPTVDRILIGCRDGARIVRLAAGRRPKLALAHPTRVSGVAFSPDGRTLATATWWSDLTDRTARLWDAASGKLLHQLVGHQVGILNVTFSPDSKLVLTASNDNTARLWDAETGEFLREFAGHEGGVWAVAFSPTGDIVLTGGLDGTARLWQRDTGQPIGDPLPHKSRVVAAAFSPDGKTFVTGSLGAHLWDARAREPIGAPLHAEHEVHDVAFSPDGSLILTGSTVDDGATRLWDAATRRMMGAMENGTGVAFSADGRWILAGSHLNDRATTRRVGPTFGTWAPSVAFSPDSSSVLTCTSDDNAALLWDLEVVPVEADAERIILWIEVTTGLAINSHGDVSALDAESWRERRLQLDALGSPPPW